MTYLDILVTLGVVAMVLFATWRVGQLNPVGTRKLERRLNALEEKVASHGGKLDQVDSSLLTIASTVGNMGQEVAAMRMEAAGDRRASERVWLGMERLEGFFIQQSFDRRAGQ